MRVISEDLSDNHYLVTYEVGRNGIRLDAFLKERYRKRSREQLKQAIDSGKITVLRDQCPYLSLGRLKPAMRLLAGDEVRVLSERRIEPEVCFDYKVLFEDDVLFIVDKPANLPVHPAGRYFFNTLLTRLRTQASADRETKYFLVHRIDKETSGVLVLAKTSAAATHLTRQFAERRTEKRYLAVVRGVPEPDFHVDLAMKRSDRSLVDLKMMIAPESEGGQSASTAFKRLSVHENRHGRFSLVECFPKTGRQHQIRLHLEAAGHPIVGDKLYGMPESEALRFYERRHLTPEAQAALLIPRHALHAASIRFEHPVSGERLEFRSELPGDILSFLTEASR